MSGCSVSIVDPTQPTPTASTPLVRSAPDQPEPSPDTAREEPSSDPTPDSDLSADGQAERARLIDAATTTMPCPSAPLTEDGAVIRIEGPCPELDVEIDAGVVIADDVGTLSLSGSGTVIYVQTVGAVAVTGSASSIFWEGETPSVEDSGSANILRRG